MTIQAGDKMPSGVFAVMTESGPGAMSADELFTGKKVVLVSVPGAFTPTCSASHLPGFLENAAAIAAKGVDSVAFVSVNDVFVMHAWGKDQNVDGKITMLADGNGDYARALGLEMDGTAFGMGMRSKRFALIADDGVATHVAVEAPGQFEVSKAESVLDNL
ncbi:MAG: peroxiredoxin [Gammaproteobacteria bacterium]|nr:MAG: peroxiredoxin [Gammaproteobacteria bacterium]RLA36428.1 MAG: peroxiredoxin [Gammaproteobacteria bacterium]